MLPVAHQVWSIDGDVVWGIRCYSQFQLLVYCLTVLLLITRCATGQKLYLCLIVVLWSICCSWVLLSSCLGIIVVCGHSVLVQWLCYRLVVAVLCGACLCPGLQFSSGLVCDLIMFFLWRFLPHWRCRSAIPFLISGLQAKHLSHILCSWSLDIFWCFPMLFLFWGTMISILYAPSSGSPTVYSYRRKHKITTTMCWRFFLRNPSCTGTHMH